MAETEIRIGEERIFGLDNKREKIPWWRQWSWLSSTPRLVRELNSLDSLGQDFKEKQRLLMVESMRRGVSKEERKLSYAKDHYCVRGVDYLYGRQDKAIKDLAPESPNPLLDILELCVFYGEGRLVSGNILGVEGIPAAQEYMVDNFKIEKRTNSLRPEQYFKPETLKGEKETLRTIALPLRERQKTLIRGLFVLSRMEEERPGSVKETIDALLAREINQPYRDYTSSAGVAIGILEVLNNLDLLEDKRFSRLAGSLTSEVFGEVGDYEAVKRTYCYTVVKDRAFWIAQEKQNPLSGTIADREKGKSFLSEKEGENSFFRFPEVDYWDQIVRKRAGLLRELSQLNLVNMVRRAAGETDFSTDSKLRVYRENRRRKAEVERDLKVIHTRESFLMARKWEKWSEKVSGFIQPSPANCTCLCEAGMEVMKFFLADPALSSKVKSNVQSKDFSYFIDPAKMAQMPLFFLLMRLDENDFYTGLCQEIRKSPHAFQLLLKQMAGNFSRKFYLSKEEDFLFDTKDQNNLDSEALISLVKKLRDCVASTKPSFLDNVGMVLREVDGKVADLLDNKRAKKIKQRLDDLTYENFLLFLEKRRSKTFTRRSVLNFFLKTIFMMPISYPFWTAAGGLSAYLHHIKKDEALGEGQSNRKEGRQLFGRPKVAEKAEKIELKGGEPFLAGKILHLPGQFSAGDGERVGFFPSDLKLKGGERNPTTFSPVFLRFDSRTFKEEEIKFEDSDLVIEPKIISPYFYPPIGWEVKSLYQERGGQPGIGHLGEISFFSATMEVDNPKRAIFVLREVPHEKFVSLGPRVTLFDSIFPFEIEKTGFIMPENKGGLDFHNNMISDLDPKMKKLNRDFLEEILREGLEVEERSEIVIKYANLYGEYIDQNRFYALNQMDGITGVDTLTLITLKPDLGFHCSIASLAFMAFMNSGGIPTFLQAGNDLRNYQMQLWGGIGHQNNLVVLPNGKILAVDMTPPVTEKTPKEDIEALFQKAPSTVSTNSEKVLDVAKKMGIPVAETILFFAAGILIGDYERQREMTRTFKDALLDLGEDNKEEVIAAVSYLSSLPLDENFYREVYEVATALADYVEADYGELTKWFLTDERGLQMVSKADPVSAVGRLVDGEESYDNLPEIVKKGDRLGCENAYLVARLLFRAKIKILATDLRKNLGIDPNQEGKYSKDKAEEIVAIIEREIRKGKMKESGIKVLGAISRIMGA